MVDSCIALKSAPWMRCGRFLKLLMVSTDPLIVTRITFSPRQRLPGDDQTDSKPQRREKLLPCLPSPPRSSQEAPRGLKRADIASLEPAPARPFPSRCYRG